MSTKEKEIPKVEGTHSEESIQETKSQEDPPIEVTVDPNYVSSLEQRLAEQQVQYRRLEKLIDNVKQSKEEVSAPTPKSRNVEEERKSFYEDPTGALDARDDKILRQMEKMLEPIKRVASSFQNDSEYRNLKLLIKQDPYFGKGMRDPDVESAVDTIMNQPGVEINENNIKSAISQAVGMKQMGMLGSSRSSNTTTINESIDPPHVRTTRTRVVKETDVRKELTEDDRLAMKIAGLKPGNPEHEKQYWELIEDETMVLPVHKKKEK